MATVDLHPEIEPLRELLPIPDLDADVLPVMRDMQLAPPAELSDAVERIEHVVDEATGMTVRVHRPIDLDAPAPCLFAIHGGGYVMGDIDMLDASFDRWCQAHGIVGIAPTYRLAPEDPYPAGLDDCHAALEWTFEHAEELGIDTDAIGIGGISAGGGLAAGLALRLRDEGRRTVQFQLLNCPMLNDRMHTASNQLDDLLVWSKTSNDFAWRAYLGDLHGTDEVPAYAAAARATDLSGLPEAYVCVGGADGFRDENIEYALALSGAGVPTELHVYPGAPHGVQAFEGTEIAERYNSDIDDWLRRQLARLR